MIPTVVKASIYIGPVAADDDDDVYDSLDALRAHYARNLRYVPSQVWAGKRRTVRIDASLLLERELEDDDEFCGEFPEEDEVAQLQALLDDWCAKNRLFIYERDYSVLVLSDE